MLSGINGCSDIFKVAVTVLLMCLIHVGNVLFSKKRPTCLAPDS